MNELRDWLVTGNIPKTDFCFKTKLLEAKKKVENKSALESIISECEINPAMLEIYRPNLERLLKLFS